MASTVTHTDHPHTAETGTQTGHPPDSQYWKVFVLLFAVTAVEVGLYYLELPGPVNVNNGALGALAILKFVVVVGYFMHLKFDSPILRRLFVMGIILSVVVYVGYLLTMGVFIDPPHVHPGGSSAGA